WLPIANSVGQTVIDPPDPTSASSVLRHSPFGNAFFGPLFVAVGVTLDHPQEFADGTHTAGQRIMAGVDPNHARQLCRWCLTNLAVHPSSFYPNESVMATA